MYSTKKYYKKNFTFYISTKTISLLLLFVTTTNNTMDNNYHEQLIDANNNKQLIVAHFYQCLLENTPIQIFDDQNINIPQNKRSYNQAFLYQIEKENTENIEQNNQNNDWQNNEYDKKNTHLLKKQKINTSNSINSSQLKTDINQKSFICHICQKSCTTNSNLKQHLITHEKDKPFKCAYCQHGFSRKDRLANHEEMHATKEKPFKCSYKKCKATFTTKYALTTHLKIHTNDKKFNCKYCPKSFITNYELTVHTRIHTGKKIACTECSNTYTSHGNLKRHFKNHHT